MNELIQAAMVIFCVVLLWSDLLFQMQTNALIITSSYLSVVSSLHLLIYISHKSLRLDQPVSLLTRCEQVSFQR